MKKHQTLRSILVIAACAAALPAAAQKVNACGPIGGGYGPYDYRTDRDKLGIVERPHFPPIVEALIKGNRGSLGGDLGYTLRAFPNHHRALVAVTRYGEKLKTPHPRDLQYPVECYYDRALRFRPDDAIVRMLYAQFLAKAGRVPEGLHQLSFATTYAENNAFTHYNIGLIYLDLKEYGKALEQAHRAYALGFDRAELRDRLQAAGKWVEAPNTPPAPAAPASAASK